MSIGNRRLRIKMRGKILGFNNNTVCYLFILGLDIHILCVAIPLISLFPRIWNIAISRRWVKCELYEGRISKMMLMFSTMLNEIDSYMDSMSAANKDSWLIICFFACDWFKTRLQSLQSINVACPSLCIITRKLPTLVYICRNPDRWQIFAAKNNISINTFNSFLSTRLSLIFWWSLAKQLFFRIIQ